MRTMRVGRDLVAAQIALPTSPPHFVRLKGYRGAKRFNLSFALAPVNKTPGSNRFAKCMGSKSLWRFAITT
jgi:hypothetical protein